MRIFLENPKQSLLPTFNASHHLYFQKNLMNRFCALAYPTFPKMGSITLMQLLNPEFM